MIRNPRNDRFAEISIRTAKQKVPDARLVNLEE